jgi:hypothetical protein
MTRDFETLVFCTSYIAGQGEWVARYESWLDHRAALPFDRTLFCMIDDASPYLPDQGKVQTIESGQPVPTPLARPLMVRFQNGLGCSADDHYPGWWRSFLFSVLVAGNYRCRKIVHTDSNAYVLTLRIVEFINRRDSGWTSFWCPRWNYPETGIQVVCEDQSGAMHDLWDAGWEQFTGQYAERGLPFTDVVRDPSSNRYGELRTKIPGFADFAMQASPRYKVWFK